MQPALSSKVELFLSARNLKDLDAFSKSDPFCRVAFYNESNRQYVPFANTEVLQNNLNPDWSTNPELEYFFESQQHLRFEVYDYDSSSPDFIGSADSTLGQIVGRGTVMLDLMSSNKRTGKLIIRAEEKKESCDVATLQFRAHHVDKKDTFGKSDPYLVFYRLREDGQPLRVHATEVIKNTLDPVWRPFELNAQVLCNGDFARPIMIECWDWDKNSSDDFIGHCRASLHDLLTPGFRADLINPKYQAKKKKYTNSGVLEIMHGFTRKEYTFIDYLRGGTQLRLMVAIDFTASNGTVTSPNSLHFINPNSPNEYERAIGAIGAILENYDTSQQYPVYGFGGTPMGAHEVSHCFPLNGNFEYPFVPGVSGILDAYRQSLNNVALAGPTLFQHVLGYSMNLASQCHPAFVYNVLLILTDGDIHDMPQTKSLVVDASRLPMSVIIIGLGSSSFDSMEALDSDQTLLRDDRGRQAARDIVQFVPFRKFSGNQQMLAREVLAELPKQIVAHMKVIGHEPVRQEAEVPQA